MEKQTLRTDLWTQLMGGEEGGRYRENNIKIYITICKIDSQWEFVSQWGFITTWRGGMGREVGGVLKWEGRWVNLWLIHIDILWKPMQYHRAIILQLKTNKSKKKKKSFPAPQLQSINSLALCLLYGPTLMFIHDYWKDNSHINI